MFVDALAYLRALLDQLGSMPGIVSELRTGFGFVLGALVTAIVYRRVAKQQGENLLRAHNFSALSNLTQSSSQAAAYAKVVNFIASRPEPEIPMKHITGNAEVEEQIIVMLGMYQFLAFSVKEGLVSEDLVRNQFLPSMRTLVVRLRPFITHYRAALDRPKAWSDLVEYVERNEPVKSSVPPLPSRDHAVGA